MNYIMLIMINLIFNLYICNLFFLLDDINYNIMLMFLNKFI